MEIARRGTEPTSQVAKAQDLLYMRLRQLKVGDTLSYRDLSAIAGADVQNEARHLLQQAVKRLRKEDRIVIGTVRKLGVKRMDGPEIEDQAGCARIKKARRQYTIAAEELHCVDVEALPPPLRVQHNATLAMLGALRAFSRPSMIRRLQQATQDQGRALTVGRVLDVFAGEN